MKSRKLWAIEEYYKFVASLNKLNVAMRNIYYKQEEDDFDIGVHFDILNMFDSSLI
jgi:hypothetical protein